MLLLPSRTPRSPAAAAGSSAAGLRQAHQGHLQLHHLPRPQQQQNGQRRPAPAPPAAGGGRRNAIVDARRDALPDGAPNTPWRRLKLRIQTAASVQVLARIYSRNRHKTNVWRPMHGAGVLMRAGALLYYRLLPAQQPLDDATAAAVHELLALLAPDLAPRAGATRVMDGARLAQLVVALSWLRPPPRAELVDPLLQELGRRGGMKLPRTAPDLLAELAAALARLGWREQPLWLAIAGAASGTLQAQALRRDAAAQQAGWPGGLAAAPEPLAADDEAAWAAHEPGPPVFDDGAATAAAAQLRQQVQQLEHQQQQRLLQQQQQQSGAPPPAPPLPQSQQQHPPAWLSGDYPKMAAALAAVGADEPRLLRDLGDEAARALPLLELPQLADLAGAYAAAALPHARLVPALAAQLFDTARRTSGSGSRRWRSDTAALVRAMHALQQLGWPAAEGGAEQQQQQDRLLQLLQARVLRLGGGGAGAEASAPALAQQAAQVLQLLAAAACWRPAWSVSPLQQWACGAVAAGGLDALTEQELQEAALALAELHGAQADAAASAAPPAAAAAAAAVAAMQALAAAAVARAHEASPGALACVLWGAVTLGVRDALLAEVAADAAVRGAPRQPGIADRPPALAPGQQARLVAALQQLGRDDLLASVMQPQPLPEGGL